MAQIRATLLINVIPSSTNEQVGDIASDLLDFAVAAVTDGGGMVVEQKWEHVIDDEVKVADVIAGPRSIEGVAADLEEDDGVIEDDRNDLLAEALAIGQSL